MGEINLDEGVFNLQPEVNWRNTWPGTCRGFHPKEPALVLALFDKLLPF